MDETKLDLLLHEINQQQLWLRMKKVQKKMQTNQLLIEQLFQ